MVSSSPGDKTMFTTRFIPINSPTSTKGVGELMDQIGGLFYAHHVSLKHIEGSQYIDVAKGIVDSLTDNECVFDCMVTTSTIKMRAHGYVYMSKQYGHVTIDSFFGTPVYVKIEKGVFEKLG